MPYTNKPLIILIDDDYISNFLTAETIALAYPIQKVISFFDPAEGLEKVKYHINNGEEIILLLDINMPTMSGWEVADGITALGVKKENITIYMLSSSEDIKDKIKARSYELVRGYFEKPLLQGDCENIIMKRMEQHQASRSHDVRKSE